MRRFISIAVAGMALVLAAPASTATSTVQIKATGFVPATVTINQDDTVTWTNTDTKDHQVVANGGSFASPILKPTKTYSHVFRGGGTFRYHDGLHPTLRGTVTVRGARAGGVAGRVGARREVRDAGDAQRRREQQADRRDGHDRGAPLRADHQAGRRHAADHERRRVLLQRHAAAQHDLPGPVERSRELGHRPGAARRSSCRSFHGRAISTSTSRPASRSRAGSSICSASRWRVHGSTCAGCSWDSSPVGSWG